MVKSRIEFGIPNFERIKRDISLSFTEGTLIQMERFLPSAGSDPKILLQGILRTTIRA